MTTPFGEIFKDAGHLGTLDSGVTRVELAQHALSAYETALMFGQAQQAETRAETDKTEAGKDPVKQRGRIDDDDFDIAAPVSNFKTVDDNVSRSGRPLSDKGGVDQILEKLHPGKDPKYQREHTAIIELRDEDQQMDDPKITVLNKNEVLAEEAMCKNSTPPIEYHRFKMQSKQFQSPEKIDNIVDTIEQAVAQGKKVSMHCFHGSDRSGLISAAYKLNSDPTLKQHMISDPDKAYKEMTRYMIENGCDPASYTTLFQSLRQYVNWKHEQLKGTGTNTVDGKNPVPVTDVPLDATGQARIDSIAQSMFNDKRFENDPIAVYKEKLKLVADDYDPATNSAFYKALRQKYVDGPPPAVKKAGLMWLPNVSVSAA